MLSFKGFITEQYIIEAKIDDYKAQEKSIPTEHDTNPAFKKPEQIIDHFHSFNPTGDVNHTRWVVNRYKAGELKQEDAPAMKETLTQFNKYRDKLSKKNINQYKSIEELRNSLRPLVGTAKSDVNDKAVKEGADLVHSSPNVKLYHVHTTEASRELGKGMPWCTSHRDDKYNMFDHYNKNSGGRFYIAHLKGEKAPYRKLGIGVGTGEFQDENNTRISHEDLEELVKRNPELKKIPELQGVRVATTQDHNKHFDELSDNDSENLDHIKSLKNETIRKTLEDKTPPGIKDIEWEPEDEYSHHDSSLEGGLSQKKRTALKFAKGDLLDDLLQNGDKNVKRHLLQNSPNIESRHIDDAIDNEDPNITISALQNKNATPKHFDRVMNTARQPFRDEYNKLIARHPNATPEQLGTLIRANKTIHDRINAAEAAENPNAKDEDVREYLHSKIGTLGGWSELHIKQRIINNNHNLSPETLASLIEPDEHYLVRQSAAEHPNADHNVLTKALEDTNPNVRAAAAQHPKIDGDALEKALNDPEHRVVYNASTNSNLSPEQIHKLLDYEHIDGPTASATISRNAVRHKNATPENIDKALNHESEAVRITAAQNPNASKDNITKAVNDKSPYVGRSAAYNTNSNADHIRSVINKGDQVGAEIAHDAVMHNRFKNYGENEITSHLSSIDPADHEGAALIARHITKPEHFNIAINHTNPKVRASLIGNRNTPSDIREKLKRDPHDSIRQIANMD